MTPAPNTLPSASNFRSTFLADRGAVVLAEHALSLPAGTPARETIRMVLDRRSTGEAFDPDEAPALTRDTVIALYQAGKDGIDFAGAVCDHFGITDEELAGEAIETIMAEAA